MKKNTFPLMSIKLENIFLWVLCIACIPTVMSQSSTPPVSAPKINNLATSPEAALLGRFGDVPMGYYTGTANIGVPLYTIKEAEVELPIQLQYHSSGIKVADEATWVGLGWDLSVGGAIIQEVRGKRDDQEAADKLTNQTGYTAFKTRFGSLFTGDYNFRYQEGVGLTTNCFVEPYNANTQDSEQVLLKLSDGYGEPDIYNYNFPGYSGKFYINPETNLIVFMDNNKTDIKFEQQGVGTGWTATTSDGTIFSFNVVEFSYGGILSEYSGKTYKLSLITFNNGRTISFEYVDEHYTQRKTIDSYILQTFEDLTDASGQIGQYNRYEPVTTNLSKTLSKITTNEAIINFNLEDREDILLYSGDVAKKLKSIDIVSKITNKKVKSFEFIYSYFPFNSIGEHLNNSNPTNKLYTGALNVDALGKRLKLDAVKETGYDENEVADSSKPNYLFEYNTSVVMPKKISTAVDFWGYYNGVNNSTFLPDLDYFDYPNDSRYQNVNNLLTFGYSNKANRYANDQFAGAYMLKKITYPTRGATQFEYELNSFDNQFMPDQSQLAIAYKPTVLLSTTQGVTSKKFVLDKTTTITFDNSIADGYTPFPNPNAPVYTYANFSGSKIVFSKTKILASGQSSTTIIKEWKLDDVLNASFTANHGNVWKEDVRVVYDPDQTVYYSVDITNTLNYSPTDTYHIANLKSDFRYYDTKGVNVATARGGGMRVKAIKNFSENGILISNKKITYYDGKLLNKFEPLTVFKAQNNRCVVTNVAGAIFFDAYLAYFNKITISTDDFGMDGGNLIGYGKVEETELANNSNETNGKSIFYYLNTANKTRKGFPNVPDLKNGLISKEETYSKLDVKLVEKSYSYTNIAGTQMFFGVRINTQSFGNSEIGQMQPTTVNYYVPYEDGLRRKFTYTTYPLITERNFIAGKATRTYFNGNEVLESESYTYDATGNLKTITNNTSNNDQLITKLYYAADFPGTTQNTLLTNKNMTGIPLVTEKYRVTELLSTQKTEYATFSGNTFPKPSLVSYAKGSNALEARLSYDLYDDKGNVLQYTYNGVPTTLQWDAAKIHPITKVENATYAQVSSTPLNNLTNAMATKYTYRHLVGVTSITDPKGDVIYYNYDAYGRLINVKDKNGKILKETQYHYITQN